MVKISRYIYLGAAWLFVVGVLTQVFLAGMVVVARQIGWDDHVSLGHFLAAPLLLMLISMYLGRFPGAYQTPSAFRQGWKLPPIAKNG